MTVTADFEVEYGGLLMGGDTAYGLVAAQGLADIPDLTTSDRARLRRNGLTAGDDFMKGRTVTLQFELAAEDGPTFEVMMADLATATAPTRPESALTFRVPGVAGGGVRIIMARPRRRALPIADEWQYRVPKVTIQFDASDPLIYDAATVVHTVGLPAGDGGLDVAVSVPATLIEATESGTFTVVNDGNAASSWEGRIDGPCLNPTVFNATTGAFLGFDVDLPVGAWLDITTRGARSVLLNGAESRYHTIRPGSSWWDFEAGPTEIAFGAAASSDALLTVTTRSAWTG